MAIVFVCWVLHYLFAQPRRHLKRIWLPIVIFSGLVLIAKYVYQFTPVCKFLNRQYNVGQLTLEEIGLVYVRDENNEFSAKLLFKELVGDVIILVLLVFQSHIFFHKAKESLGNEMANHPRAMRALGIAKALLYLHGGKVVAWMVFGFGVSSSNMIHFIYVFLVLSATAFRSGKRGMPPILGFVLLIFAMVIVLAQMAFGFSSIQQKVDDRQQKIYTNWIGLENDQHSLAHELRDHICIVILLTLHRMSYWWIHGHPQPATQILPESGEKSEKGEKGEKTPEYRQPTSLSYQSTSDHVADALPGAYSSSRAVGKHKLEPAPVDVVPRIIAYLVNFYSVYGYEIFFIVTCIAICFRTNIMGIIYIVTIIVGLVTPYKKALKALSVFVVLMGLLILLQYFFRVGLPRADPYPWSLDSDERSLSLFFLLIPPQSDKFVLMVDFAVFYFAGLVVYADKLLVKLPQNFFNFSGPDNFHHPRVWHVAARYFIAKYSAYVVLVGVFVCGLGEADVISLSYLGFSLFVLFMGNRYTQGWSRLWEIGRAYALGSLTLYILWQLVLYGLNRAKITHVGGIESRFGLEDITGKSVTHTASAVVNDILVVILLSYQKRIFRSRDFRAQDAYVRAKRMLMLETAQEFFLQKRERELTERREADRQQLLRWERLQLVKMQRAQGIVSRASSVSGTPMVPTPAQTPSVSTAALIPVPASPVEQSKNQAVLNASATVIVPPLALPSSGGSGVESGEANAAKDPDVAEVVVTEGQELSTGAKIKAALRSFWDLLAKYTQIGMTKFINWLDEEGKKNELTDDLLLPMDEGDLDTLRREEAEKEKEKAKIKAAKKAKYKSMHHVKPPTSTWHWVKRIMRGFESKITNESKAICFFAFILNAVVYANVLSLPYPVAVFAFGRLQDDPRPSKVFWRAMLGYSTFVILIKYIFQLLNCIDDCEITIDGSPTLPFIFGVHQDPNSYIRNACLDALAFLLILWHRHVMRTRGIWDYTEKEIRAEQESLATLITDYQPSARSTTYESGPGSAASSPPQSPRGPASNALTSSFDTTVSEHPSNYVPGIHPEPTPRQVVRHRNNTGASADLPLGMGLTMGLGLGGMGMGVAADGRESSRGNNDKQKARKHIVPIPIAGLFGKRRKKRPMSTDAPLPPVNELTTLPPDSMPSSRASSRRSTASRPVPPNPNYNNNNNNNNNNDSNSNTTNTNPNENTYVPPEVNLTSSGDKTPKTSPNLSANANTITTMLGGTETPRNDPSRNNIIVIDPQDRHHEYSVHEEEPHEENDIFGNENAIAPQDPEDYDPHDAEPLEDVYSHDPPSSDSEYEDDSELEDAELHMLILGYIKHLWHDVRDSVRDMIRPDRTGRDYYTPLFLIDFTCFIILIVLQQWFTGDKGNSVADFLEQSVIPRNYVGLLLAQFGLIILDRAIYLYRSVKSKLILQIVLTILYHALLFFYLPDLDETLFKDALPLILFYLLKCAYLYISALQICYGYPFYVSKSAFMEGYGDFNSAVFSAYRAIPFVFEISTLLEWIVTDTTLLFYDWIKCEDIFAQLYQVKCRNEWIKRQGRAKGQKQPKKEKCSTGVLLFIVLLFVIWFPLIILSSGLPGSQPNLVTNVQLSVGVQGWNAFFEINQDYDMSNSQVTNAQFNFIKKNSFISSDDEKNTQILLIPNASETVWTIAPPSKSALVQSLDPNNPPRMFLDYTFTRNQTINQVIKGSNFVRLTSNSTRQLINVITGVSNESIYIPGFIPRYIRLPGVSGNSRFQGMYSNCQLTLVSGENTVANITNGQEWWVLSQFPATSGPDNNIFTSTSPQIVSISTTMPAALASTLVSAGIIGLYVGVVLSIGRFLRMYVTGITLRIWIENLPHCDELLRMCHDIFLARQYGDLMLEEELYQELIQIFRSPETLIDKTKLKLE
eukprot:Phypoly_transcript_00140.p1 GENE.Phypoly_transcript_00140~~Phypoly_transcript_00140.p1  ORF type:complete len:2155 (+),score=404.49 Phypoly_transcript_00140:732-6467(+)